MKIKKFKKYQLLEIDWIDSVHDDGSWKRESFFAEDKDPDDGCCQKTAGYFLRETPKTLMVIQSRQLYENNPLVDAMMQIPKVAISKIKELK